MSENRFGYLRGNKPRRPEEVPFIERIARVYGTPGSETYTGRVRGNPKPSDTSFSPQSPVSEIYHAPATQVGHVERFRRKVRTSEERQREEKRQARRARQRQKRLTKQTKRNDS